MTTTTVTSTNTLKYDPDRAREGSHAFTRLYNNDGTDRVLCDAWNSFTNDKTNQEQRDRYMADSTFMNYYLKALYAKTVPSKRKALSIFLEFMKTYTLPVTKPIIIKGDPSDKWDEVQELSKNEDRPFIYVQHNGTRGQVQDLNASVGSYHYQNWIREEEDDIVVLLSILSHNRLDHDRSYITLNPCAAVQVGPGKYVDGERLYPHATVMSFSGAFENITHGFRIDTNHAPTCELLLEAFEQQGIVMDEDDD